MVDKAGSRIVKITEISKTDPEHTSVYTIDTPSNTVIVNNVSASTLIESSGQRYGFLLDAPYYLQMLLGTRVAILILWLFNLMMLSSAKGLSVF